MSENATPAGEFVDPIAPLIKAVWWLVLLRGIFAVLFGILAVFAPLLALVGIVFVFATYALIDGVVTLVHAIRVRATDRRWGWLLAQGVISVLAGIAAFVFPGLAGFFGGLFVLWLIAFYSIMAGISGIPAAAALAGGGRKVLAFVLAILSILLGVALIAILFANPAAAIVNLIWVVGVWAIIAGVMLVVLAIQARIAHRAAATV